MFEPVWSRVVGGSYVKLSARVHGFRRMKVKGDVYPVVVASQDRDWVDGFVYRDVTAQDVRRLDAFEGEFYDRQEHVVVVDGGDKLRAAIYVLKDCFSHLADDATWDTEGFAREGLEVFLGRYKGFL